MNIRPPKSRQARNAEWYSKNRKKAIAYSLKYYHDHREDVLAKRKTYVRANREKIQQGQKRFYQENREYLRVKSAEYRKINRKRIDEAERAYYHANKEKIKEYVRAHPEIQQRSSQKLHLSALALLGGKCSHCGETFSKILHINHINPFWERGKRPQTEMGTTLWRAVLKTQHPEKKYSILCGGCNWRLWQEQEKVRPIDPHRKPYIHAERCEILKRNALRCLVPEGGTLRCSDCDEDDFRFLTVNHFQKKWSRGERPISEHSAPLWRKILRERHPEKEYNVLCRACNWKRYFDQMKATYPGGNN
jgi:hypothetical protein